MPPASSPMDNPPTTQCKGQPVSALVSVFNNAGNKLLDLPIDLKANQQLQLNSFLSTNHISLADAARRGVR